MLRDLMPLQVNHFQLTGGEAHWRNFHSRPPVDIYLHRIELNAQNLRNTLGVGDDLPAEVTASALAMRSGRLEMRADLDPLDQPPDFDLSARLLNLRLTEVNPWLRTYIGLDASAGRLDVVVEAQAQDGVLSGYLKPIARRISLVDTRQDDLPNLLYEAAAGTLIELFENQGRDQFALRIPIEGRLEEVETGTWAAVVSIFRNAFIEAYRARYEHPGTSRQ